MADIQLSDFRGLADRLQQIYPNYQISDYRNTVESDYAYFLNNRKRKSLKESAFDTELIVPQKYQDIPLSYLLLYHFVQHFIQGVQQTRTIVATFQQVKSVNSIRIVKSRRQDDIIQVAAVNLKVLDADIFMLKQRFNDMGNALLGERFRSFDFINEN